VTRHCTERLFELPIGKKEKRTHRCCVRTRRAPRKAPQQCHAGSWRECSGRSRTRYRRAERAAPVGEAWKALRCWTRMGPRVSDGQPWSMCLLCDKKPQEECWTGTIVEVESKSRDRAVLPAARSSNFKLQVGRLSASFFQILPPRSNLNYRISSTMHRMGRRPILGLLADIITAGYPCRIARHAANKLKVTLVGPRSRLEAAASGFSF
jgi:hypothetical protein